MNLKNGTTMPFARFTLSLKEFTPPWESPTKSIGFSQLKLRFEHLDLTGLFSAIRECLSMVAWDILIL